MASLEPLRATIDEIDDQIAQLFEQRMDCVHSIARYKANHHMVIEDKEREAREIESCARRLHNAELTAYYREVEAKLIEVSKAYQSKLMEEGVFDTTLDTDE